MKKLCVHGHFYQPPRENPWLEAIELQSSAAPFHDWNERIHHECYLPNVRARVFDAEGCLVAIVNNFQSMSFNFGPTLLAWLERAHPSTYERVIEADSKSVRERGHGNAIAQAYNHVIMPFANERDKATQVRWGLADFRKRFGRDAEAMWLPETACNEATLEVLAAHGMRYVILAPQQAEAFREKGGTEWSSVADGSIDPKQAYLCRLPSGRSIAVFFYDGPISKALGFEDLLADAPRVMNRLESAGGSPDELVHVATDGETYGHHKPFGDRVLAYLLNSEAPARGWRLVNYAEFLEAHPPVREVKIKNGENGEGTAWSCAHGVRRWRDDCGCRGGGPEGWHQRWRAPLRSALDGLRDALAATFEREGANLFRDVWAARDAYVDVVLDRSEENLGRFFETHLAETVRRRDDRSTALKLLEMQRHAMLMYTSCGWFFTEISGIETVQVLQYAARAIQLAAEFERGGALEASFLAALEKAESNVPEFGTGRGVYEKLVRPRIASLAKVVSYYAIGSLFESYYSGKRVSIYCYDLDVIYQRKEKAPGAKLNFGRVRVRSPLTLEERELSFAALQTGPHDFRAWIAPYRDERAFSEAEKGLFEGLEALGVVEIVRRLDASFGPGEFALKDLLMEDRLRIVKLLTEELRLKMRDAYDRLFEENRRMNEIYFSLGLPIPPEMRFVAERSLSIRLDAAVKDLGRHGYDPKLTEGIQHILHMASEHGFALDKETVSEHLAEAMEKRTRLLYETPSAERMQECLNLVRLAEAVGVAPDFARSQDHVFRLASRGEVHEELFTALLKALRISSAVLKRAREPKPETAAA